MAQLNSLIVTGDSRFLNPINGNARNGVYYVKGTQTAATDAWTGVIPIPALYDGLTIMYYLPYAPYGNATLNLTLSNGTTTGAINCYYNTGRLTTHYDKGSNIVMTYHSAGSISVDGTATTDDRWIANANYNTDTIGEYAGAVTAGGGNMAKYSLIMQTQLNPPTFASLVTTSSTATTKTKQTCGFIPNGRVLYQSASTYAVGGTVGQFGVWVTVSVDLRYSFNITTTTFPATDVGKSIYIKCTLNSTDGKLYLADTTWWATELPTTQDNFYYVFVGQLYSRYQCTLYPVHPIYYYNGTEIVEYSPRIEEIVSNKMDKVNPAGSGYFSLNRKAGTTIGSYSFAEGYNTTASAIGSHAENISTADGQYSHSEGCSTTKGQYSHAEGNGTISSGVSSHSEGNGTVASGAYSHAEGGGARAIGDGSHAEGAGTQANGIYSHAEGTGSQANGDISHAEGNGTIAAGNYQHVSGTFNITDEDDIYAEIIGNGTYNARSNARTLDWSGNEVLSGTIEAAGFGTTLLNLIYPVGSIYISVNNVNPGTYLTGTTWVEWGAGRVPVGVDTTQTEFNTVEKTGGEKTHTLTVEEMPAHDHLPHESAAYFLYYNTTYKQVQIQGGPNNNCDLQRHSGSTGGNSAHNNMQPYITCYMWKRTA